MLSYRKNNRLGYFYDIHSPNEFSLALGTRSPSYVVLRTNHRFASKLVLWATRSIKQPFRLFYLHLRKNCTEQPPHLAVKARLFITARTANSFTRMRVSASEPQHFAYSHSLYAEFRQAVFADASSFHLGISGVRRKRLLRK